MGRIYKRQVGGKFEAERLRVQSSRGDKKRKARPKDGTICKREAKRQKRYTKACEAREEREAKREQIADSIATLDFETDPFAAGEMPRAFCAGFKRRDLYEVFWSEKESEVIQWAREKVSNYSGYVYAHNGGKFDFPAYLLKNSAKEIRGEKALVINGRLVKMRMGKAEIRDSYAILPAPLSTFDKGEIDYRKLHKTQRTKHMEEIKAYLKETVRAYLLWC